LAEVDRVQMIWDLGSIANSAAQRGDDHAAATIRNAAQFIMDMHADLQSLQRRREKDRTRKHSKDSADSTDSVGGSQGFPGPLPNSTTTPDTPRAKADSVYAESVDNLIAIVTERVGDRWGDVDGFLKRRQYQTWKGWLKEMLTIITGGKATADDLASVCRDDAALERPIGSPSGLRSFVAKALLERTSRPPSAAAANRVHGVRPGIGQRAFDTTRAAIEDM
jgi:hypothetical protein